MANSTRSTEKEEFWRLALREHQQSGLTIRAFCQREGLSEPAFFAWRKKLENRKSAKTSQPSASGAGKLVPLHIIDSGTANDQLLEIVTPGGFKLRCGSGVEATRLAALLDVIVRCDQGLGSC